MKKKLKKEEGREEKKGERKYKGAGFDFT